MGFFDKLTGTKRPAEGVAPRRLAEVTAAILAVNRPTAPFAVYQADGTRTDRADRRREVVRGLRQGRYDENFFAF
jgi:hypothetical protein